MLLLFLLPLLLLFLALFLVLFVLLLLLFHPLLLSISQLCTAVKSSSYARWQMHDTCAPALGEQILW